MVANSGDLDCTQEYLWDRDWRLLEVRNGSGDVLKQQLWGARYIDELVQVSINTDPADAGEDVCDANYYPMQNANFNVLGLADANGVLVERYEYTPYGQRTVFTKAGINDTLTTAPLYASKRVVTDDGLTQPYGLCEFGHQGLMHEKEFGLVYVCNRHLWALMGRWATTDLAGYADGLDLYEYEQSRPLSSTDAHGLRTRRPVTIDGWVRISPTRWKATKATKDGGSSLHVLSQHLIGNRWSAPCIWPVVINKERDSRALYNRRRHAACNDVYDVSNLIPPPARHGNELRIAYVGGRVDLGLVRWYSGWPNVESPANGRALAGLIRDTAKDGDSPIARMTLISHGGAFRSINDGEGNIFGLRFLETVSRWGRAPNPSAFDAARGRRGPPRCWFAPGAQVKLLGCLTDVHARGFANNILRSARTQRGFSAGTTHYLQIRNPEGGRFLTAFQREVLRINRNANINVPWVTFKDMISMETSYGWSVTQPAH